MMEGAFWYRSGEAQINHEGGLWPGQFEGWHGDHRFPWSPEKGSPAEEKKGVEVEGVWLPSTPGCRKRGLIQSETRH